MVFAVILIIAGLALFVYKEMNGGESKKSEQDEFIESLKQQTKSIKPNDNQEELAIMGTNHRTFAKSQFGYSEDFRLEIEFNNPYDEYAVAIYRGNTHVGYVRREEAKRWHKRLSKIEGNKLSCPGFLSIYKDDSGAMKTFGRVYPPIKE